MPIHWKAFCVSDQESSASGLIPGYAFTGDIIDDIFNVLGGKNIILYNFLFVYLCKVCFFCVHNTSLCSRKCV